MERGVSEPGTLTEAKQERDSLVGSGSGEEPVTSTSLLGSLSGGQNNKGAQSYQPQVKTLKRWCCPIDRAFEIMKNAHSSPSKPTFKIF